jgi:hypothetical protein
MALAGTLLIVGGLFVGVYGLQMGGGRTINDLGFAAAGAGVVLVAVVVLANLTRTIRSRMALALLGLALVAAGFLIPGVYLVSGGSGLIGPLSVAAILFGVALLVVAIVPTIRSRT